MIFERGKIYEVQGLEHSKYIINVSLYYFLIFYLYFIMTMEGKIIALEKLAATLRYRPLIISS